MTSVGRAAAVIFFFAAVVAAAPFASGTRFGMVGFDYRASSGRIYSYPPDSECVRADPFFRLGLGIAPKLALGADLALFNSIPKHGDVFLNTPVFAFGPVVTFFPSPVGKVQTYATAGGAITYKFYFAYQAWRFRLSSGALLDVGLPVSLGAEIGWYADVERCPAPRPFWLTGSSFYLGLRLSDLRV